MKLIGRRSVASVLRWILGFVNLFVALGVIVTGFGLVMSVVLPDFVEGFRDGFFGGFTGEPGPETQTGLAVSERITLLAAFVTTASTWWIINRLRRIFLAVNQGDAFEPANVARLRWVGLGLIGVQVSVAILVFTVPLAEGVTDRDYRFDLGAWLGILIVFMLAEVFRQGAAMRDDQQMTV